MSFTLSEEVDTEKVFVTQWSDVSGNRFEPKFYTSIYSENEKRLASSEYPLVHLREVTNLISDGTHFTPVYKNDGVKFISVKDVRKSKITYTKTKFISIEEADKLDRRCKPQKKDILLTKIGATYGFAAVVETDERFQIFVSVALLRPNPSVNPRFLEVFLNSNLAYLQYHRAVKGAGVPDLHLEDIRKVKMPLPPIEKQIKISKCFELNFNKSKQKEQEAQELLDGIDDYLLKELGIELPEEDDRGLEGRMFTRQFSEVSLLRWDPEFSKYRSLTNAFKYPPQKFVKLLQSKPQYGANEPGITRRNDDEVRYIRITDIDEYGNLKNGLGATSLIIDDKYQLESNDLLFARSGNTVGKCYLHKVLPYDCIFAGYMIRFKIDEKKMLPEFAFAYTQSRIYKEWVKAIQRASGQPNINSEEYKNLLFPVPPLDIQSEMCEHIGSIRTKAKQLKQEAETILTTAKAEVEQMILGGE